MLLPARVPPCCCQRERLGLIGMVQAALCADPLSRRLQAGHSSAQACFNSSNVSFRNRELASVVVARTLIRLGNR